MSDEHHWRLCASMDAIESEGLCAWCEHRPATRWAHNRADVPDNFNARVCDACFEAEAA